MEPGYISVRAPHTMACVGIELSVRAAAYDGVRWDTGVAVILIVVCDSLFRTCMRRPSVSVAHGDFHSTKKQP